MNAIICKKTVVTVLFAVICLYAGAQDFAGFRTGNYNGVNGVFFNPANIADSRYRFDLNLFSLNAVVGNNQASFKLGDLGHSFNGDSLKNQVFGKNAGPASGLASISLQGPSLMFNIGKLSFALSTRGRVVTNISNIDGKLFQKISQDFQTDPALPYTIQSGNDMRLNVIGWTEYGFSVARQLSSPQDKNLFKMGVTIKYLQGVGNAYLNINNFTGTLNQDNVTLKNYLTGTTGHIALGFSGGTFSNFTLDQLTKGSGSGIGGDIGFVYEIRRNDSMHRAGRDENKYRLKIGVALLDLGSILFTRDVQRSGAYDIHVTGVQKYYLSDLSGVTIDNYNQHFQASPQYFTPTTDNGSTYSTSLPTTLQLNLDYNIHRGFYLDFGGQIAMSSATGKPYNPEYFNAFTVTPRFEGRAIGLYVPINYNELTKFNAGLSVRLGPLFFGSGSILTSLFSSSKQADLHIGFHIAGLQHRNREAKPAPADTSPTPNN